MNLLDYTVVAVYITGFLFLGKLFKENETGSDYFLGGKSFGWFPLALSTAATQLSAISFISAPAFVGLMQGGGMKWLTYEFAVPIAMIFLMVVLIPPMYKAGIVSVYEYLERRFDASTRMLLSLVFQISRAFATSVMIYTVALILTSVMDFPFWATIVIIGIVTLVYSYQGGMKAVIYGDMIQMLILILGIGICFYVGLSELGGVDKFLSLVDQDRIKVVDFSAMGFNQDETFGFWPMIIGGFFLYVSYYGTDQSQVQRLFSAKNMSTVNKTLLANGLIRFPITLLYCLMGLVIGTLVMQTPSFQASIPSDKLDLMVPIFIRDFLPHGIIGILMVAIFSAAMSSLSSAINSLSAATVEDLFNRKQKLSDKQYMIYSKYSVLFWGLVCVGLAFFTGDIAETVIEAINKIGSVFYGPILATFIAALIFKKLNATGANVGLLTGVLVNVFLWLFVPSVFWFWWNAIGALVTLSIGWIFDLSTKKHAENHDTIKLKSSDIDWDKVIVLGVFFVAILLFCLDIETFF